MQDKKLRIGVDATPLLKVNSGISTYVFYLLDEIVKQNPGWDFYLYAPSDRGDIEYFKRYSNAIVRKISPFARPTKKSPWRHLVFPFLIRKDKINVFWGTTQKAPLFLSKKIRLILTVYDFVYLLFPGTMAPFHAPYMKVMSMLSIKRANYLLPISEGTAQKLKKYCGLDHHGIVLPPHKPSVFYRNKEEVETFLSRHSLEYNNYLVTVGTWEPRKNFVELVEIYVRILEKRGADQIMPLVIIGGGGWKDKKTKESFRRATQKYPGQLKVTGFLEDHPLSLYLSGARYYVTLSLYEGYGMPIAEARHCRTPSICLDSPEIREAAENEGVFLTRESLELQLEKFLKKDTASKAEKPSLKLTYPSNKESAEKITRILESISL